MVDSQDFTAAEAIYPDAGTLRVHPNPDVLLQPEPERPGLNRFDDPLGLVAVRYSATRLIGCLLETLARFRPSPTAETVLAGIEGVDANDVDWPLNDTQPIADWLSVQRVGRIQLLSLGPLVAIEHQTALTALDKHPLVREAISDLDPSAHLDVALIRLGGTIGRPVSQAAGAAVREWMPNALGIGYRSRLSTDEPCWAIWQSTRVEVTSTPLDPADPQHRAAVQAVADGYEILLPSNWV